jgi:CheY-like chemotaxis protein
MNASTQRVQKVLIIDRCDDIAESMSLLLTHLGNSVKSASSYAAGLIEAGLFKPNAILLDVDLLDPKASGSIDRLRKQCGPAPVRIVAFTGYPAYWVHLNFHNVGFDGMVRKPAFIIDVIVALTAAQPDENGRV